jgi:enoyl-CoA hydratase/carnithine racemase
MHEMNENPRPKAMNGDANVICEKRGAIWILTITNLGKENAFTSDMSSALQGYLVEAENCKAVRCVVITGAGNEAFSSGHDLTEDKWQRPPSSTDEDQNAPFVFPASMETPTIAAVNGHAYAAGFVLAINCDLRVASRNATFCASGARMGLLPVSGQISRLPALLPYSKALELLVASIPMEAEDAHALGFVNRLMGKGQALEEAMMLAEAIAGNSPTVIREIKRGLNIRMHEGLERAREFEFSVGAKIKGGPDHKEGVKAFLEKRAPIFGDARDLG